MNKNWETIYETTNIFNAELIQELLNENAIESILLNQQDSSYLSFGEIKVLVKRDSFILAKKLINEADCEKFNQKIHHWTRICCGNGILHYVECLFIGRIALCVVNFRTLGILQAGFKRELPSPIYCRNTFSNPHFCSGTFN